MTEEELATLGWSPIGEVPYREFMRVRVFDSWMHEQDIRRAPDRPGHLTGPVVRRGPAELHRRRSGSSSASGPVPPTARRSSSWPRATPPGSTRWWSTAVPGWSGDACRPDPTVTITLPFPTFVALGGGRWNREEALAAGRTTITGDEALGRAVLDGMAFTP